MYTLKHHGIKGQKWGIKNGPPYPIGESNDTLFISGSSKTQDPESPYFRKLPKDIRKEIDSHIKKKDKIIVGDAPGIDRQVQDYLKKKKYSNVEIYGPGKKVRYNANKQWKENAIDDPDHEEMSPEWLRKKDIAMTDASTRGLAVILDEGAKATRNNIERLIEQNKDVKIYQISKVGKKFDKWIDKYDDIKMKDIIFDPYEAMNNIDKTLSKKEKDLLGIGLDNGNVPVEKFFFDKDLSTYLIATDYHGKFKDEHPIPGKILGIAAKKESRGKGLTDKLIKNAKEYYKNDSLIAEIDKENIASRKLFERNGFKKIYDDGYIDYYQFKH